MKKRLSIIIPVYNNASGIVDCVKSIDVTDRDAIEVIIIDDGSDDGTKEAMQDLAKSFSYVKCLFQEHGGVVAARKLGLSMSCGEYIWFVDSDDLLCEGAVDGILSDISVNCPDMLVFDHCSEENGKRTFAGQKLAPGNYNRDQIENEIFPYVFHDFRQDHFRQPIIDGFLWNKVWKKDLISKTLVKNRKLKLFEDAISVFMAVSQAQSLYKSSAVRYIYVKGSSATSDYRNDYFLNTAMCAKILYKKLKSLPENLVQDGKKGANAFITERLIVSIVREMRYRKDYLGIYRFVSGELKKYRIQKRLKYDSLPLSIKVYLFLLKAHLYIPALIIAKGMA